MLSLTVLGLDSASVTWINVNTERQIHSEQTSYDRCQNYKCRRKEIVVVSKMNLWTHMGTNHLLTICYVNLFIDKTWNIHTWCTSCGNLLHGHYTFISNLTQPTCEGCNIFKESWTYNTTKTDLNFSLRLRLQSRWTITANDIKNIVMAQWHSG